VTAISASGDTQKEQAVEAALLVLSEYNDAYLARIKSGRLRGLTPEGVALERAQSLKVEGMAAERQALQNATRLLSSKSTEVTLGIMAESGVRGLGALRAWVSGLSLPKGVLRAVDENGLEVPLDKWNDQAVYIKYNSSDRGDAYMKPYNGGYVGCIFQPKLADGEFRQYGDLPLNTLRE